MDAKLSSRLSKLQLNASKESLQTLAKWMSFNRKFAAVLSATLLQQIRNASESRKLLPLSVAHEVLVVDFDVPMKWQRMANFRRIIGDVVVKEAVADILGSSTAVVAKIEAMVEQWDAKSVFGSDTADIILEVRDVIQAKTQIETDNISLHDDDETVAAAKHIPEATEIESVRNILPEEASPVKNSPSDDNAPKDEPSPVNHSELINPNSEPKNIEASPVKEDITKDPLDFDFESEGVEFGKVQAQDFLDPCKSIATMQIAREIRNDTAARLMTILQTIPKEVEEYASQQLLKSDTAVAAPSDTAATTDDDDDDKAIDALEQLPTLADDVLDLDITEALSEVKQFRDVVLRQRQARKRCIDLLIKSRCQFGSTAAAQEFFNLGDKIALVKKRKLLLSDAMELEGLDFEGEGEDDGEGEEEILEPLSWFKEGESTDATTA